MLVEDGTTPSEDCRVAVCSAPPSFVRVLESSAREEVRLETVAVKIEVVDGRTLDVSGAGSDDVFSIPEDSDPTELNLGRGEA